MIRNLYKDKKLAVIGFGIEGKDLVKFLLEQGARVTVLDRKGEQELAVKYLRGKRCDFITGSKYLHNLTDFETIFRSPGVYRYLPELTEAEERGVEISSAIKTFFELCPCKIIGVTGTKGKGTTSTLIYKILKNSGKDVFLAGNIGKPYLEVLPRLTKNSLVVLELSSFQLIDLKKSPHIAVVLNVTEDHLDWHKDRNEYVTSKKNLVRHQGKKDYTVLNYDFKISRDFFKCSRARKLYFSKSKKVSGCFVNHKKILLNIDGSIRPIGETSDLFLRGRHNWKILSPQSVLRV